MSLPQFHRPACAPTLDDVLAWTGATAPEGTDRTIRISTVAPLDQAGRDALSFLDNPRYADALAATRAAACLLPGRYAARAPAGTIPLVVAEPYRAVAIVLGRIYPDALRPGSIFGTEGISPAPSFIRRRGWRRA